MNLLAHISSFKGREAFVIACDKAAIRWLADQFGALYNTHARAELFVIGNGKEIESDGELEIVVRHADGSHVTEMKYDSLGKVEWLVSSDCAMAYRKKILAMLESLEPCHNYLDISGGKIGPKTIVITKDEYPINTVRAMRDGSKRTP